MAKRYLDVSYDDRELAKRLGAKWDPSVRRWYCPSGSPLAKIFKWRAEAKAAQKMTAKTNARPVQNSRPSSDIDFKTTRVTPPQPEPAINQNFELFMAS